MHNELPFRHWVADEPLTDVSDVFRECLKYHGLWVQYDNDCERRKRTSRNVDRFGPATRGLFDFLLSDEWVHRLRGLTGVEDLVADPTLHGAGVHVTDPGGWLQPHLDFELHPTLPLERRINAVAFLNDVWSPAWGGAFELWDDRGEKVVESVLPQPSRVVVWESSNAAYHGVGKVSPAAQSRVTAATYYLSAIRPGARRKRALFCPRREP